jgi:YVTN family beta-propeller protein
MRIVRLLGALAVLAAVWLAIGVSSVSAAAVVKTIPVGSAPEGVSSDGTHVWVANFGGGTVSEIDASTGTVVKTITVGSEPEGVSSDGTHVWVANSNGGTVSEIDESTGTVVNTIPVGSGPQGVSSDGTDVWVTNYLGGTVSEIDASTGTVVNTITVGTYPIGVSSDGTHVWVANSNDDTVSEIDASTGTVVNTITVGSTPDGVSSDGTHVWVTTASDTVSEIDASTGTVVKTIKVGSDPQGVSSDGRHVWVENAGGLSEIDASTGTVVNTIPVGSGIHAGPFGVSSDGTHVWVTNAGGTVSEIQIGSASTLLPPPVLGKSVDAAPVSGVVLVKQPGKKGFVRLLAGERVPVGSTIDTTAGVVSLTAAESKTRTTTGRFYAGQFRLAQKRARTAELTVLTLTGPKPTGCAAGVATAARKKPHKRSLWGSASGGYRTVGSDGSATELGTKWLTEDTCAGTLIRVAQGAVTVDDFPHHRTFVLRAPHSFLAHPGKGG